MRKYIIKSFLFVIGCAIMVSCYEDKSNYDYKKVGDMEIIGDSIESLYRIMMGSELKIVPYFKLNDVQDENLEYKWEMVKQNVSQLNFKLISTERNLNYLVNDSPASYDLRYTVTDKKTGISVYHTCIVEVTDAIARAFLLLCKVPGKENEYDISAANEFPTIGRIVKNIYSDINGETIKDATKLAYYTTYYPTYGKNFDMLCVFKKNGGEELSSFDLAYQKDASEWFFEKPDKIVPEYLLAAGDAKQLILVSDGGVYFCEPRYTPRKARLRAEMIDGTPYRVGGAIQLINGSKAIQFAFWDELGKRFIQWHHTSNNLQTIDAVEGVFDPNAIGDKTPLYIGHGFRDKSHNFMKDKDGTVHLYTFKNKSTFYLRVEIAPFEHAILDKNLEFDKATSICPSFMADIVYYAVGDKIWIFNPALKSRRLFLDFKDPSMKIVDMFQKDNYTYKVFVAANKGKEGYVYRVNTTATGDIVEPTELMPVPYDTMGPYDEIVDMQHKYRGTW